MAGYDPKKAAEYNKLIQQGVAPEAAIAQAGITAEESGNYEIDSNTGSANYGQMDAAGGNNPSNIDTDITPPIAVSFPGGTYLFKDQAELDAYSENPSNYAQSFVGSGYTVSRITPQPTEKDYGDPYVFAGESTIPAITTQDPPVNPASDPSQFPAYDDAGNLQLGFAINEETGQPYYRGVEPPTQDRSFNPASDPSQFPAYDDAGNLQLGFAINEETGQPYYRGVEPPTRQTSGFDPYYDEFGDYDAAVAAQQVDTTSAAGVNDPYYGLTPQQLQDLGGADPTDPYIRARLGIPQLPGSTLFATGGFGTIKTGVPAIDSALSIIGGGITSLFSNFASTVGGLFGPKPTASATAATTGAGVAGLTEPATGPATRDTPVNPASDPSQFPAYDDEGYLQPGFAINDETGQPYYRGIEPPTQDTPVNPASDPSQFPAYDDEGNLQPGFAINDETGQTYYRGLGPGTRDTSVNPASDPSQFPAYDDEGYLQPGFAINDETGQPYYQGEFYPTRDTPVNPASDPSQFPAYDDEGNLQPGFAINDETGQPYYAGVGPGATNTSVAGLTDYGTTYDEFGSVVPKGPPTGTDATTLSADQADAFYNGTGTLTPAQQAATDAQTAADAAALYPGTNNTNLRNINEASAAIAQNEAGIARAQEIIAQNNAELADPNISDERRAELEANNAAQENYIRLAESNTAENELVIEANADAFAAGGGEPDSGQAPLEVAALEDPGLEPAVEEVDPFTELAEPVDPDADPELLGGPEEDVDTTELAEPVDPDADPELLGGPEEDVDTTELAEPVDPDADPELLGGPDPEIDPFEPLQEPPDVEPDSPELLGGPDPEADGPELLGGPEDVDPEEDTALGLPPGAEDDEPPQEEPFALNPDEDEAIANQEGGGDEQPESLGSEESFQGAQEAAIRDRAKQQATFQARYKQQGNQDWRVRLSLSPNADYLYNASSNGVRGAGAGILAPLAKTDGVIFPYTPSITTTYSANYEQYDLIHSNYRGLFYKNSRVGDIQVRGTFTAQDSVEANYLLAVIHFFRSVTKMFYGQDAQRGAPPPVCLLNGFGDYQFSNHPVVVSSFNYTTPNDVDYIRATDPNNYGTNLLNRRAAVASNPGGQNLAGAFRLANALLQKGAPGTNVPDPGMVQQSVSNTAGATYVPTKMEIDITLIPVQTRTQVSKQFSLKGFANGQLLKGGFW